MTLVLTDPWMSCMMGHGPRVVGWACADKIREATVRYNDLATHHCQQPISVVHRQRTALKVSPVNLDNHLLQAKQRYLRIGRQERSFCKSCRPDESGKATSFWGAEPIQDLEPAAQARLPRERWCRAQPRRWAAAATVPLKGWC